ncbi:2-isopropylmalate synthase [Clostridium baratii]|uniref:2-isopropylmalate synthase n=1 Tax=Clostridium baratii TaxID=1561 RepID=UPI0009A44834|nr:2-isopropylmalate synthase [Clostridium baratii]OPF51956.1 2-isopropylmalate synthase [Clostridium baratii]OPF53601.1 2-isopropylmalate synthase [Clostridium baratii]OPF56466.1 2-isopropylmalate synthase [Clostridium baratii]OPF60648.1 2-isopropylmalate synthase [Clostridium baratii]
MKRQIYIFDTTLRDGEQTPKVSLNPKEKLEIAKQLEGLGVDVIEAGFPMASNGDFEGVKLIAENIKNSTINALARANKKDIDRAYEAIKAANKKRIHIFIATSELHMKYKLKMTREEVIDKVKTIVKYAKGLVDDIEFSPEDGSRSDREFLYKVLETAIESGATVLNIPDTVGYSTPKEFGDLIKGIKENVKGIENVIISVHCHNDLGLAVANSLAAVENGATQVECAINGLGERAGNTALEEIVMALKTRGDIYNVYTNIKTENIYRVSSIVSHFSGVNVQPNKAIVGKNAFLHESGIHQHGVLENRETYEIMTPESVGFKTSNMILGKHSGRHAFEERVKELGCNLDDVKLNEAFKKFKDLADKKKEVSDKDIEALIYHGTVNVEDKYKLINFSVTTCNKMSSTATVNIKYDGKDIEEAACGDGPVNALYNAVERAINKKLVLKDYNINAITSGADALGEVIVKLSYDDKNVIGRSVSTNVIEASIMAYMNALNKIVN